MYATTHVLASIVISQHAPNLWWAFFVSLVSHYILDFIPHGDRPIERWVKRGPHFKRLLVVFATDIILLTTILFTIYQKMTLPAPPILIAAIIGGLLPDALLIMYDLYERYLCKHKLFHALLNRLRPFLDHHTRIHSYIDSRINTHRFPAPIGALIQLIFVGAFIILAVYFW